MLYRINLAPAMSTCLHCGETGPDGALFCPKCGYTIMRRGANVVTSNLAVGMAAALATGGLLGPSRKKVTCGGCGTKYLLG